MVSEMLQNEIKNSIGMTIVLFIGTFRFEGKIIDCDNEFVKYFDNRKCKPCFKKLSEINEMEILG